MPLPDAARKIVTPTTSWGAADMAAATSAKIKALEGQRATMQLANRMLRKGNTQALLALGFSADDVEKLKQPDANGQIGFADYTLRSISDKIADLKAKLKVTA